jgi:hypothetical protein
VRTERRRGSGALLAPLGDWNEIGIVCKSLNGRSSVASNDHVATSNGKRGQTETRKSAKNRRSPIRLFGSTAHHLPHVVIASCYSALLVEEIRAVSCRASSICRRYLRRLISGNNTATVLMKRHHKCVSCCPAPWRMVRVEH